MSLNFTLKFAMLWYLVKIVCLLLNKQIICSCKEYSLVHGEEVSSVNIRLYFIHLPDAFLLQHLTDSNLHPTLGV